MKNRFSQKLFSPVVFIIVVCLVCSTFAAAGEQTTKDETVNRLFDESWACLSRMHKDSHALERALDLLEKAKKTAPDNEAVYWKLAEVVFKMADEEKNKDRRRELYEKTIDYSDRALAINPRSVGGHYWKGCACARLAQMSGPLSALGLVRKAKKELYAAIDIDGNHRYSVLARTVLAAIYTASPWPLRDLKKAEKLASRAVALDPRLTLASLQLAKVYLARGDMQAAKKELQRGLSIKNPTYVWDSVLYDWPEMKELLKQTEE